MFRFLIFDWPDDPAAWSIVDEYVFGDSFLVCPVLNASGVRSVYLPKEQWGDFWTGQMLEGPYHLHETRSPLERLPLYVRLGSQITFAEPAQKTRGLATAQRLSIRFDENYHGVEDSGLSSWTRM